LEYVLHVGSDGGATGESRDERLNRELLELLNELRVALPGVQVLFAFLLTLPFTSRFGDLSELQRDVYFATFLSTTASSAFLMTPTAFHRIRFRQSDKEWLLTLCNRMAIAGLVGLAISLSGAVYLVSDVVFGSRSAAIASGATAALVGGLWFVLPILRSIRDRGADD
jgi:hypothetical protein